ncbi:N(alpha)-acetyltransferase 20, NatB catalytic subunit [Coelomomyces lativittatus]|nr:N(alpha)-acetyltransferase 20, NatB catalytic subunit [Coelomomyces lativittatus]
MIFYDAFFVDLFVRESNQVAIQMYQKMGYIIYRCVLDYYSGGSEMQDEDAMGTKNESKKTATN